jgi:hypothetical protein
MVGIAAALGGAVPAAAQCVPPANSNEARLLAFYEVPVAFATTNAPMVLSSGGVALTGELVGVPRPSRAMETTGFCYPSKQDQTHLAPVLPRLRLTVGLPAGFALEGSYLPPVTVDQAQPNLGSLALSYARRVRDPGPGVGGPAVTVELRAHGTLGRVRGPITCSRAALQQTDPAQPCYGTKPSEDAFYPNAVGGEGTVGATQGRLSLFAGAGYMALAPHFRVDFTSLGGATDRTLVEVDLNRGTLFGGLGVQILPALDAAAEVYSVPADLTTWRLAARYRLR